ncbi:TPA: sodium ion-translocating decarboxylase subunit beta [Candidatus Galligastranaerophilus intestinavium]|uniref:Sodium ion-translocating decarboxylase subunit beta n=1 Tax=Candidatus Galligastranaerophilus intestinavium TaxID=2840836 RepID=A0A9D1FIM7_9BACT|nr:sodium ion-translocating decarboxylase subunit beta [Candidatus Galligastranaerophilus intestinavium]
MNFVDIFQNLWKSTGIFNMILPADPNLSGAEQIMHMYGAPIMFLVCLVLLYLGIKKEFEPLLLVPIAFGGILANIPVCDIAGPKGFLGIVYEAGIHAGLFPLFIFMGVGAMTDFGPLIANPKTALLGGAAQFGIFSTLLFALLLGFTLPQAASIGIIGGADGPTSIFVTSRLAPELLGAIAVAAYSYMALVPIIQPPIMKMLTTKKERLIEMTQMREVSQREKIVFPLLVLGLCIILLPDACPLVGALAFGNLCKESGVVERLSKTLQNEFINIVTILLGLSVGSKLQASQFLTVQTLYILILGLLAFSFATGMGVIFGRIMNKFSKTPINPLIGAAGVSAVPMAARVVNKVGLEYNPNNYLLMHAMGPNVAGVIGSAVAAGVLLAICS